MKKYYNLKYLLPSIVLVMATLLLISCKKSLVEAPISDAKFLAAKAWYQTKYPKTTKNSSQLTTLSQQSDKTPFSSLVGPDWDHSASYSRLGKDVIEAPLDPSSQYSFSLKGVNKAYSKTSLLVLSHNNKYWAYVMLIAADSTYINGDQTKLSHNTYRHIDNDFSGSVIYFSPEGKLISHFLYKDGKLLPPGSNLSQSGANQQTQSLKTNALIAVFSITCVDTWKDMYVGGVYQGTDLESEECYLDGVSVIDTGDGDGIDGTDGGQPQCPPGVMAFKHQVVNGEHAPPTTDPGPGDGGTPDPTTTYNTSNSCIVPVQDAPVTIVNNVKDPCLHGMVDDAISKDITFDIKQSMNSIFGTNADFNIIYEDGPLGQSSEDGLTDPLAIDGPKRPDNSFISITSLSLQITLNSTTLTGASKEYIAATIIHESLHAYFFAQNISFQHDVMYQQYIPWFMSTLQTLYPGMSDFDAKSLALGGLDYGTGMLESTDAALVNSYRLDNDSYKSGHSGTPCH
jgi:hypothetical protein